MSDGRLTSGIKYAVVGRYMNGSFVSGYHLMGEDGSQLAVSKNKLVYLVGKGIITNCRVQMYNGEPLLRGKGINLNDLAVYDKDKGILRRRNNDIPTVKPKGKDPTSIFGQLKIVARLITKTQTGVQCVGYVVENAGGVRKNLSRNIVLKMASEKQIGNARIQSYNGSILLRGVGIDLSKLPAIQVDKNGKIINKNDTKTS